SPAAAQTSSAPSSPPQKPVESQSPAPKSTSGAPSLSPGSLGRQGGDVPSISKKPASKKLPGSASRKAAGKTPRTIAKARRNTPRFRRIHQAFVASATLKPMARQLLQDRTPA